MRRLGALFALALLLAGCASAPAEEVTFYFPLYDATRVETTFYRAVDGEDIRVHLQRNGTMIRYRFTQLEQFQERPMQGEIEIGGLLIRDGVAVMPEREGWGFFHSVSLLEGQKLRLTDVRDSNRSMEISLVSLSRDQAEARMTETYEDNSTSSNRTIPRLAMTGFVRGIDLFYPDSPGQGLVINFLPEWEFGGVYGTQPSA